jgi:hypothetical protein
MADDNRVEIEFGAKTDEALAGVAQVEDSLLGLAAPIKNVGASFDRLGDTIGAAFPVERIAESAREVENFGASAQRAASQTKAIGNEIKLLQQGLAQKKILLDAEAKQYQITQDQKFALLEAETQKEFDAQLVVLQNGLMADNITLESKQALSAKIAALEAKHKTDMLKLDEQSIAAQQALWNGYLSNVTGAFNSQLRGLLEGTTTWKKASVKILEDLTIKFIEMAEATVVKWLAAEIAKTTATTSGALARAETEQMASSTGIFAIIADALKSIYASGGKAGAGVAAAVAPEAGPAAPAIGAAAGAAVVATALGVMGGSKFDLGTDYVLRGGLAMIHQGETIVPAMARGTGPYTGRGEAAQVHAPVSVNISAMDSRSVERFFHDNARHMIRAINNGIKSGAHLGLRGARA